MIASIAAVRFMADFAEFHRRMFARIEGTFGFRSRKVGKTVHNILYLKASVPLTWFEDVCIYFKTDSYLYVSSIEQVVQDGNRIALVCRGFLNVVSSEETPNFSEAGLYLATVTENAFMHLVGQPSFGLTMYPPHLPS